MVGPARRVQSAGGMRVVAATDGGAAGVGREAGWPGLVARREPGSGVVVAATDFGDPALPAVVAAGEEARLRRGRLEVLNVIDLGGRATEWMGTAFGRVANSTSAAL